MRRRRGADSRRNWSTGLHENAGSSGVKPPTKGRLARLLRRPFRTACASWPLVGDFTPSGTRWCGHAAINRRRGNGEGVHDEELRRQMARLGLELQAAGHLAPIAHGH